MEFNNEFVQQILLEESYISEEDLQTAIKQGQARNVTPLEYLLTEGVLTKDILGQALAEHFKVDYSDLNSNIPSKDLVLTIPEEIARKFRVVLFSQEAKRIVIATDEPTRSGMGTALKKVFKKKKIVYTFAMPEDIDEIFRSYYRKELKTRFNKIIEKNVRVAPEIIDAIFEDAQTLNASDIHFEPTRAQVLVRFRIDGVLREVGRIPKEFYINILNRIKVQAHLRIDEHLRTQDGSLRYNSNKISFDARISIVPLVDGEKIAIRILSHYVKSFALSDLGLSPQDEEILREVSHKPFGMILVVGPTGSGKSTTLYAVLKLLNDPGVNITTIEDPVEYKIDGVNHIQVNEETNLTFAQGLRSIVRQDPDIILVGEIRDEETAEIAVNAALTGHLLLSTFHANDAATAIPRLFDMGIEPFLLSSTLEVVLAQRLIRRLCNSCKYSTVMSIADLKKVVPAAQKFFKKKKVTLYKGKGCNMCNNTGYHGRIAVFEFIKVTPELQALMLHRPSTQQIWELAQEQGGRSLFEDGLQKVAEGITTLEELLRVAKPTNVHIQKTTKKQKAKKTTRKKTAKKK